MQNKNIQMLNYFDSALKSKLNTEYKCKSSLDIISNISEYNKYIPFNTKLNNKLFLLKKIERNLMNSNKNILTDNKKNIITNIKKDLNNKNINNQINKNLITRIKNINTNLKNNINLPLNIIGNPALNKKNINYLSLITSFNPEVAKLKNTVFNFNLTNNKLLKNVYTILEYSFKSMSSLISKPYLYINQDKIIIHLFFYKKVLPNFNLYKKNEWNIKEIKSNQ